MLLTNKQITNLIEHGWDDTICNINSYISEERKFIVDKNIEWVLNAASIDENLPRNMTSFQMFYRSLEKKNLRCSCATLRRKIIPSLRCNNKVALQNDSSVASGDFNQKFYELASIFFVPGFLDMGSNKKISLSATKRYSSAEAQEKHRQAMNMPEKTEKHSQFMKNLWAMRKTIHQAIWGEFHSEFYR